MTNKIAVAKSKYKPSEEVKALMYHIMEPLLESLKGKTYMSAKFREELESSIMSTIVNVAQIAVSDATGELLLMDEGDPSLDDINNFIKPEEIN